MELWQSLLVAFGGNAALLLVLGFLGRAFIGQYLAKDIQRYRSELDTTTRVAMVRLEADLRRTAFEHETRFVRLHVKRAEVVTDLYRLLMVAFRDVEHFVHPMEWIGEPPKSEQFHTAMNALVEFAKYYDQRRIFLPHALCENLDAFSRALRLPPLHLHSYIRIEHPTPETANEKFEVWHKAWETIRKESGAARIALENEFRELLGAAAHAAPEGACGGISK